MSRRITDIAALEALYGEPATASIAKEVPALTPGYRALIEASPFFVLATSGPGGLDASPRGDGPGFVRVADDRTLLVPDRRGNNRIDSLRNILADPRVGLLFLVPGLNETLRVNGRAVIDTAPALCDSFAVDGKAPKSVLVVTIETVFFQCARALLRSRLWDPTAQVPRSDLPSVGALLAEASAGREGGDAYDRSLAERIPKSLY
ncbi:pyridoxamine 5'-phosphate oxidase family protein [Azospirillum oryzae]|uniref:Pyridoxamine 5'-phosphate oxidase family protein n=1 Tax=Azospirillum oryzae TaxID=286727 RepID=A0A6N1AHX1_9PROT|nr:pyridoxamine 5'-phosphate oxidase family protein [Azospirillum oryzae]KAA0589309.1 pyridoxamine 5'-phosphate oxidase family protein [Azospirillum oryzae]QKS51150.1 pyridoxamine 5'-phosphate oxidase family protein [Azospirillum oryzae]GLR79697.1 pyridoxamine 5'-phosphate oxidase [Azospirillum oryzae]